MAFLSGIVKSSLSLLGKDNVNFGYAIGDKVEFYTDQSIWSLHRGTKKDNNAEVSVFIFDCTKNKDRIQLAKNAFKKLRTVRHPDILCYLDGVETEQSIMIVTDPVEPLSNQIHQDRNENLALWGFYKVANAINFLNKDCALVHGNLRVSSIFTTKAGEWKLGGFELLCSMNEESPIILTFGGLVPDAKKYATPEIKKAGWTVIKELPVGAIDSYHLGCLIYETYNYRFESTDSLLSNKGNIPTSMQRIYSLLLSLSLGLRASAGMFLEEGLRPRSYFSNDFIQVNLFLENISMKEQSERERFFRQLESSIETFPKEFSKHKILPELVKAFEFGSGGAKALSAIVKIGEHLTEKEYETIVIQPIIRMFGSPDRAIRVALLDNMPKFIDHMTKKMVTQIFPNISTGFTDNVPVIREQTVKSILLLVPKMSEKVINYELLKHLAKLQMDPEPGIRTNTTICLGKIAKYLSDATRKKVLVPAFTRSLRDGFLHARIAALMALNATSEFYDGHESATRVIPAISMVLLDKERLVRDQAFKVLDSFIKKVQEAADMMPETAITENKNSPLVEEIPQGAGMAGVLGGATKNLAGWAVSSIQSRFVSTPSGEIGNPMSPVKDTSIEIKMLESSNQQPHTPKLSDSTGWDNTEDQDLQFDSLIDDSTDGWDSFDPTEPAPFSPLQPKERSAVSSFGSVPVVTNNHVKKTQGSMKLVHKPKTINLLDSDILDTTNEYNATEANSTSKSIVSSPNSNTADRKLELERRREERRQRMAELKEKKKGGLGAKKIENMNL